MVCKMGTQQVNLTSLKQYGMTERIIVSESHHVLLPPASFQPSSGCGKTVHFALADRGEDSPMGLRAILVKIILFLQSP